MSPMALITTQHVGPFSNAQKKKHCQKYVIQHCRRNWLAYWKCSPDIGLNFIEQVKSNNLLLEKHSAALQTRALQVQLLWQ